LQSWPWCVGIFGAPAAALREAARSWLLFSFPNQDASESNGAP
jgi:hypothetical protein